jgi:hypothetical protein
MSISQQNNHTIFSGLQIELLYRIYVKQLASTPHCFFGGSLAYDSWCLNMVHLTPTHNPSHLVRYPCLELLYFSHGIP